MSLEAIRFTRSEPYQLTILNQLLLPFTSKYITINTIVDAYNAIKLMQVRGAPAIAIVGALSVVVELSHYLQGKFQDQIYYDLHNMENFKKQLVERLKFLITSRPTAVNLANAINEIIEIVTNAQVASIDDLFPLVFKYSADLYDDDFKNNFKLGENGKDWILKELANDGFKGDFSILTICNTGSLATSGYGTALGVVRSLWSHSKQFQSNGEPALKKVKAETIKLSKCYPLETRPYNQGSRLTAYELVYEQIPSQLITDSMVTYLISTLNKKFPSSSDGAAAPIKACVVGADRIVRNGDTANKIGTFQLSLICRQFGIKFLVVAPKTTVDLDTLHGDDIIVEQRPSNEFQNVTGGVIDPSTNEIQRDQSTGFAIAGKVGVAAPGIEVWNPSFDITPHEYIDGIVTEDGVITKDADGEFDLVSLFR